MKGMTKADTAHATDKTLTVCAFGRRNSQRPTGKGFCVQEQISRVSFVRSCVISFIISSFSSFKVLATSTTVI